MLGPIQQACNRTCWASCPAKGATRGMEGMQERKRAHHIYFGPEILCCPDPCHSSHSTGVQTWATNLPQLCHQPLLLFASLVCELDQNSNFLPSLFPLPPSLPTDLGVWQFFFFFLSAVVCMKKNGLCPGRNGEGGEESYTSRVRNLDEVFLK